MVNSTQQLPVILHGSLSVDQWLQKISRFYGSPGFSQVKLALNCLEKYGLGYILDNGANCYQYGLQMADVLFQNETDAVAIAAALLLELIDTKKIDIEILPLELDTDVLSILKGVEKMSIIRTLQNTDTNRFQIDKYRKMLLAIIEDVRIVLVKLAERVCHLRSSVCWTEKYSHRVAEEILDIYAPLANRLGLYSIKKELEDKALFFLHPAVYKAIKNELGHVGCDRVPGLELLEQQVKARLFTAGITLSISGRVKHIYSIWKKMNQKSYDFNQLYDINAIRILVDSVPECYQVLSIIHENWDPVHNEYADYISNPKTNGYQSIHTVIQDDSRGFTEIQVRTFKMHADSELGVAAHWRYKEGVGQDISYEARITWLRSLIDWQKRSGEEVVDPSVQLLRESVVGERVYVFTPGGDVIDLPERSTVLDFAYNVHTMVGHRCRGGKVDGNIVPLTYCLKTGDQVQILTNKDPSPSKDWMSKKLGYIHSAKIRGRVSRWFKARYRDEYSKLGKEKILSEINGKKLKKINYTDVARYFNLSGELALFAAVYVGDLRFNQVVNYLLSIYSMPDQNARFSVDIKKLDDKHKLSYSMIVIHGIDGLMSNIAGCCKPVLGDDISGYITKGRGISVHMSSCKNFLRMKHLVPERVIDVQWGKANTTKYLVDLKIICVEESIVSGIYGLLSANNVTVINVESTLLRPGDEVQVIIRVAVSDLTEMDFIIAKMKSIRGIVSVNRQKG